MSRGMDGSMKGNGGNGQPMYMQAIVIGGAAHGTIVPKMLANATIVELRRPEYLKPLESPTAEPTAEYEKDIYEVCTIFLTNDDKQPVPFGICLLKGKSMTWAFSELVRGFAQNVLDNMKAENIKQ